MVSFAVPASAASRDEQNIIQGFRGIRAGEPSAAVVVQFGVDDISAAARGSGIKIAA